jgi:GNAT superfamily N-acetyltransferase
MLRLRTMTTEDIELGLRLKDQAGWNQTAADWQRFLALEPDGCFVAELDGWPVGTTTTCSFEAVGWIAMVLVDVAARHQGIGTRLVEHALAYLQSRGASTIRLDATPLGRPVYERIGFTAEYELTRLEGTASAVAAGGPDVTEALPDDADALAALDRRVTGANRRRLLARLLVDPDAAAGKLRVAEALAGYVMLRRGGRAMQLGPAVAITPEAGQALLNWALRRCDGWPVLIDIPCDNGVAVAWAQARGLIPQRRFTRMYYDRPIFDQHELLWASSGPEKG